MNRYTLPLLCVLAAAALGDSTDDGPAAPWRPLFNGTSLDGWKVIEFGGDGPVQVKDGVLTLGMGAPFTGLVWTNAVLRNSYEIELEAQRVGGSDFFCGLTVPVGDACCSLIVGGWGGGLIGISSIDDLDASENATSLYRNLEDRRWYHLRLRIADDRIRTWLDRELIIDQDIEGRKVSLRPGEIERCQPLGLSTWATEGAIRNFRIRRVR